jgi:dTDP-4-dehydrorhamnose 3,5-epimerase
MRIVETPLADLKVIEPKVFEDHRGYFLETYNREQFLQSGISSGFIQDNESMSSRGVIRGLHYQLDPFAQAKLVRVITGAVFDVAVDLRKGSPTFGKWFGKELSGENKLQMLIPRGFAHGFSVLSTTVVFAYKCDNYYNKQAERGIRFNDPFLAIDWQLSGEEWLVSEKDRMAPLFAQAEMNFI